MGRPTLSKSALRALPAIQRGVSEGLSSTVLQRTLTAGGIGVRRTDLLEAIRFVKGVSASGDSLRAVPHNLKPDPQRLPLARTIQIREYAFIVRVTGSGPGFNQDGHRWVTVSSSELLSRDDIELEAMSALEEGEGPAYEGVDVASVLLVSGQRSGRFGTLI